MKKALALLLAAGSLMCFAVGCGDSGDSDKGSGKSSGKDVSSAVTDSAEVDEKIRFADSWAKSLAQSGSSAFLDLEDKFDENISGKYWLTGKNIGAKGETLPYGSDMQLTELKKLSEYISEYFSAVTEVEEAGIYFMDGMAVGSYVKTSDGYFGTYPGGLIKASDYTYNEPTVDDCVELIEKEAGEE